MIFNIYLDKIESLIGIIVRLTKSRAKNNIKSWKNKKNNYLL